MGEVTVSAVTEIKSFAAPPQLVKDLLGAVLLLFGYSEQQSKRWENALKCMGNPRDFISRLKHLETTDVSESNLQRAGDILRHLDVARVRAVSSAAADLCAWASFRLKISYPDRQDDDRQELTSTITYSYRNQKF